MTTKIVIPVLHKELESPNGGGDELYSNGGLGDVSVAVKWAFFIRNRFAGTTRLALAVQASFPTGSTDATFVDGRAAPRPLQLGAGAFAAGAILAGTAIRGRWGISISLGQTRHASGKGYRFGAATRYDLAIGLRFPKRVETIRTSTLQLYLELNGSLRASDRADGSRVEDSGGHMAFLSPALQWVPLPQLLIEASVQIPVIQDLDGSQPRFGLRPAAGARFLFF
ncbi:MAG: transporter [Gemmatimonadetes bacterium]|nr:transporter [Gemmatimonadota bacterium]NIW38808.1 hypothetical protein [Gemmatimonadota bacterium]